MPLTLDLLYTSYQPQDVRSRVPTIKASDLQLNYIIVVRPLSQTGSDDDEGHPTAEVAPEHGGGATIHSTAPPENVRLSDTDRLETFSDGIFAITITLLVFDIVRPDYEPGHLSGTTRGAVAELRSLPRLVLLRRHHLA